MRALVASSGMTSHFAVLLPVLDAFARRGDEVMAVIPAELEESVRSMGCRYLLAESPPTAVTDEIWSRFVTASRAERSLLANRELFGRLWTAAMLPVAERACNEWLPDLVVHEPTEYASAIAAQARGIRHAQVAISLAEVEAASLELAAPALELYREGIVEAVRASTYLTRFPSSLDPSPYATTIRFRASGGPGGEPLPDWWGNSTRPLLYATFGTVALRLPVGVAALRMTLDAVAELPVRVLITIGRDIDVSTLGPVPDNAHVEPWVPQGDVLRDAALVICHGGSGTTFAALAAGVPLVMIPLFADQLTNAELVTAVGAGMTLELGRGATGSVEEVTPEDVPRLRAAIETVLTEAAHRQAAERLAEEMSRFPLIDDVLETLAGRAT